MKKNRINSLFQIATVLIAMSTGLFYPQLAEAANERARGFGESQKERAPGFGKPEVKEKKEKDRSKERSDPNAAYSRSLMRRYDRDGDGILSREEWSRIRGTPERADTNGDGKITFEELYNRVSRRSRQAPPPETKREESTENTTPPKASYRLITPHELLPNNLPSWFKSKDTNQDGQVAMHEYSKSWNDSTARKFKQLDKNNDGFISVEEANER